MEIKVMKPTVINVKKIEVDAVVRYWEDSEVNGVFDFNCDVDENEPRMPCVEHVRKTNSILPVKRSQEFHWKPIIDIETGRIENWREGTTANVEYILIDIRINILDENCYNIHTYESEYVPDILCPKFDGYGDYIIMRIDQNGYIQGWNKELITQLFDE